MGPLRFISTQHHFNFNQLSRKFADVSLLAKFSLFLKKTEPGLTKMTTVVHCMFSLLIGSYTTLSTFTNVKALRKHKLNFM